MTGEGEPYRPETLLWTSAEGAVLGHTVGKPGELATATTAAAPPPGAPPVSERGLREAVLGTVDWREQRRRWERLKAGFTT